MRVFCELTRTKRQCERALVCFLAVGKVHQFCLFDQFLKQRTCSRVFSQRSCFAHEKPDVFEMRRTTSDGQASGSTVYHDTPHVLKVCEGVLRFALCDRLNVPSNEHTTMIHDARWLTAQRERSPALG